MHLLLVTLDLHKIKKKGKQPLPLYALAFNEADVSCHFFGGKQIVFIQAT